MTSDMKVFGICTGIALAVLGCQSKKELSEWVDYHSTGCAYHYKAGTNEFYECLRIRGITYRDCQKADPEGWNRDRCALVGLEFRRKQFGETDEPSRPRTRAGRP